MAHLGVRRPLAVRTACVGVRPRVTIVGAGWSGLACALTLAAQAEVTLIDAAPQVGGRARRVDLSLGGPDLPLDNGQHLMIGAYRQTLQAMRSLGLPLDALLLRLPFTLAFPDGFLLQAARLPAPLHLAAALLNARGLSLRARVALALALARMRRAKWTIEADISAAALLADQPAAVLQRLWTPLCLAALNVPLAQASARVLLAVLRDSVGADAQAAEFLIPRVDLSAVFAEKAAQQLHAHGVRVLLRHPVQALARAPASGVWSVRTRAATLDATHVILALPPWSAANLLDASDTRLAGTVAALRAVEAASITTVYLRYPEDVRLARPMFGLADDPSAARFGQWVFDRGRLAADDPRFAGLLSVVISGDGPHLALSRAQIAAAVARQLAVEFGLPAPLASQVIIEKRATIVPAPGLRRPAPRAPVAGLWFAGDAADSDYPSTLEGSVRAGIAAAHGVLSD